MAECDYCERTFEAEEALLEHMRDEHAGELGRIDQRRVGALDDGDGEFPTGPLAIGFVVFAAAAVVAFVVFGGGGSGAPAADVAQTPYGTTHEHGIMEVVVLGDPVDFSQDKYQVANRNDFHFESGNGRVWHAHSQGVTIEFALATLDIGVTENSVTFDGTTYRDNSSEYSVSVTVNGEPVDPATYVLEGTSADNAEQGDHVRIVVERADESNESA